MHSFIAPNVTTMSNLNSPLDYFMELTAPEFDAIRKAVAPTRHLQVYYVAHHKLVRACSLDEFRVAVSVTGALLLAYVLDELASRSSMAPAPAWAPDNTTLKSLVSQGESPVLMETACHLFSSRWPWPREAYRMKGYQGGIEGYNRLASAAWTAGRQVFDTTAHGISSVGPRVKEAIKHLKNKGYPIPHEKLINDVMTAIQLAPTLMFLDV